MIPLEMGSWPGVEVRHLAALAAVHEERSFRGAAERLGYVQSAVSQRIAQLERIVGTRLVERSRGHPGVELTRAGRTLVHHAEHVLSHLNAARAELHTLADGEEACIVRVGVLQSLATRLVPRVLALLAERSPWLRIETRETLGAADLFAAVESGELDIAFAELPLAHGPFEWCELLADPLVLLVPAGSPLAGRSAPPTPAQIAEQPLVVDPTWRRFSLIREQFSAAGLELKTRFTATTNTALQALVGAGLGSAIMPRLAVDLHDAATEAIDLGGVLPPRTLACYWQRDRSAGGQAAPAARLLRSGSPR